METLHALCSLIATPGDEGAVFEFLIQRWQAQGLDIRRLGAYAVIATPGERKKSDTILLTAHADSPGFIVCEEGSTTEYKVVTLGGIRPKTSQRIATPHGDIGTLHFDDDEAVWTSHDPITVRFETPLAHPLLKGDRLAWAPSWTYKDGIIETPFLDNRAGCAILADWYEKYAHLLADVNVILAVTAMEEVNGFGAAVLAKHIEADAIIALDATYANEAQGVDLGKGPVATLSDASAILSPALRDRLLACGVPLQTEVYNYSGTDARAFPMQGCTAPVVPLLLPTTGNHSPVEKAAYADYAAWPQAIAAVAHKLVSLRQ